MSFFSAQVNFEGNLYSTYFVKVLTVGITISGRRDRAIWKIPKTTLELEWRLGTIPQADELK